MVLHKTSLDGNVSFGGPMPRKKMTETSAQELPSVLKPIEAAKLLRVDMRTILSMIARGELPASRIGRVWRIPRSAVQDLMEGKSPRKDK
jgi:excisionase family DNA binding protein